MVQACSLLQFYNLLKFGTCISNFKAKPDYNDVGGYFKKEHRQLQNYFF